MTETEKAERADLVEQLRALRVEVFTFVDDEVGQATIPLWEQERGTYNWYQFDVQRGYAVRWNGEPYACVRRLAGMFAGVADYVPIFGDGAPERILKVARSWFLAKELGLPFPLCDNDIYDLYTALEGQGYRYTHCGGW